MPHKIPNKIQEQPNNDKFVKLSRKILRDPNISRNAKALYALLLDYAWDDGECYPSQQRMCEDLGISKRTLKRDLDELRELGLIEWKQRGYMKSNRYSICSLDRLPTRVAKYDQAESVEQNDKPDMADQDVKKDVELPEMATNDLPEMATNDLPDMATSDLSDTATIQDTDYYTQDTDTQSLSLGEKTDRRKTKNGNNNEDESRLKRQQILQDQLRSVSQEEVTEHEETTQQKSQSEDHGSAYISMDPLAKQIMEKLQDFKSARYYQKVMGLVTSGEIPREIVISTFFETLADFKRNSGINRGAIFTAKLKNKLGNSSNTLGRSRVKELSNKFLTEHSI